MENFLSSVRDIIKSITLGLIISLILILISSLGAILVKHGDIKVTLEVVCSTLFIVGGVGLILYSGFILKGSSRRSLENDEQWKKQFRVMNFVNVILVVNIMILISGIVIDNIRYYL